MEQQQQPVQSIEEYEAEEAAEKKARLASLVANRQKLGIELPALMVEDHGGTPTPSEKEAQKKALAIDQGADATTADEPDETAEPN